MDQMDMVPMVTLPYYSIYPSSYAKDSQEKNHTQKVKELAFIEKKEKRYDKGEVFLFYRKEGLISLIKERMQ